MRVFVAGAVRWAGLAVCLGLAACSESPSAPTRGGTGDGGGGPTGHTAIVLGAGDIGMCGRESVAQTARLVASLEGHLLLAGDLAYPQGSFTDFRDCFDPHWGQFRPRWNAAPGNHDYDQPGAVPYFNYFGSAAGPAGLGYYALRIGDWLILMLNSNVPAGRGSAQLEFVRGELEAQRTPCTMAVWHHPLFSSGPNGQNTFMRDMWALLESFHAEVILNGHDHLYERFARQMSDGRPDPTNGIRQFIVGTGGADLYQIARLAANSEERMSRFGVIRLTLRPALVEWEFLAVDGTVLDRGLDTCR